ncbi:MAG: hypothetical protein LUE98_18780 [Tannerellaceae bacterium]|nr:hypothetical protein [Tannerellaceae bacterium]
MKNILFFCLFLVISYGCNLTGGDVHKVPYLRLIEEVPVVGEKLEDFLLAIPGEMDLIDNHLLFRGDFGKVIKTYNLTTGVINEYGLKGQGPFEFITPFYAGKDVDQNLLFIWDVSTKTLTSHQFSIGEGEESFYIEPKQQSINKYEDINYFVSHYVNDSYLVAQRTSGLNTVDYFLLLDSSLQIIKHFGENPFSVTNKNTILQRGMFGSFKSDFTFVGMSYGYIVHYHISTTGATEKNGNIFFLNRFLKNIRR